MPRNKKITLFNKNRILVTREILNKDLKESERRKIYIKVSYSGYTPSNVESKLIEERKISPLGFYYTKTTRVTVEKEDYPNVSKTIREINFYLVDEIYHIEYCKSYGGAYIGIEVRPWQLGSDKSMPEHFVDDLLKVIKDFIAEVEVTKDLDIYEIVGWKTRNKVSMRDFCNDLMIDMFGNVKGPRYQTDDEKILSHGFDLKESFRKSKEK